ncbi:hypothetical protein T459_09970 [Capsicum annuum]|uniref:KIB1-4 beta-propeller domain-containing protein n=1 Tax=Capsicum annuum TaxID=4072 RepID=A0A2G3A0W1_CAPAN|nr:hypothetical protein T459_09970 [Capsicum annuum]
MRTEEEALSRIQDGHSSSWIRLDSPFRQYTQIVYHSGKKLFYTFITGEDVFINEFEAWDLHSDPIKRFHFQDQGDVLERMSSWPARVEDDKDLICWSCNTRYIGGDLEYLEDSIGNRAIFLGKKRGFALSTTEFPELRSGCIYFADDRYAWKYNFGGDDMGIYDYEDNSIIEEVLPPSSNWFIPDA